MDSGERPDHMDSAPHNDDPSSLHQDVKRENEDFYRNENDANGSIVMPIVFLGNLSMNCTSADVQDLFERKNSPPMYVERVDLKRGFCFIYFKNAKTKGEKDRVERYVNEINGIHIDKISKQVRAELARGDGRVKRKEDARRANIMPSETLFVVNFHEETTRKEDLEMLFQPYGELMRIDMKNNYAFVQFASVEEAKRAKEATNGGKLDQSAITVEYVARRMDERPRRGRDDFRGSRGPPPRGPPNFRRDRYDEFPPPPRRSEDYRGGPPRRRSPVREYDSYYRRRPSSRSRSRSPPRRPYDRDDYRSAESGGRRYEGRDREYDDRRGGGRSGGPAYDRGFDRGYRSDDRGYAGRDSENDGGR